MKRLLGENQTTGLYETVATDGAGSLNTTGGGGAAFNGVIKGVTDINDPTNTIKNIKVDSSGAVKIDDINSSKTTDGTARTQMMARTTIGDDSTKLNLLCDSQGHLITSDVNIQKGKDLDFTDAAGLQQVLVYGRNDVNANLHPLRMSGDYLFVEVQGFKSEGVQNNTSSANPVQLLGYDDTNTRFRTVRADATGKLMTGICGYTDIADDATSVRAKISAAGSLQVKQDDHASVVVQGVSDQANPFGTKKPLLIDTAGKLLTEDSQLTSNSLSVAALTDSIKTLITDATVSRGSITFSGGTAISGGDFSNAVDVGTDRKTIHFFISGMANTHAGMIVLGSQDNSNFYNIQQFTPQTVGATVFCGGSVTSGYRYFKFENTGIAFTLSAALFNSYN